MHRFRGIALAACVGASGCAGRAKDGLAMTPEHAAALQDSVRRTILAEVRLVS